MVISAAAYMHPQAFLPLKPRVFLMLLALVRGAQHGYALKEEVSQRTDGRLDLGPGTLYRTMRALLEDGLIEECAGPADEPEDERKRYYEITALGRRVVAAEAERLAELIDIARDQKLIPSIKA